MTTRDTEPRAPAAIRPGPENHSRIVSEKCRPPLSRHGPPPPKRRARGPWKSRARRQSSLKQAQHFSQAADPSPVRFARVRQLRAARRLLAP
jgi:hypothetical protein